MSARPAILCTIALSIAAALPANAVAQERADDAATALLDRGLAAARIDDWEGARELFARARDAGGGAPAQGVAQGAGASKKKKPKKKK